jgi:hypothetical protein
MLNVGLCIRGLGDYDNAKLILQTVATAAEARGFKGDISLAATVLSGNSSALRSKKTSH